MASNSSLQTGSSLKEQLCALAGSAHVRPAGTEDAIAGTPAQWVAEPGSEQEVASLLHFANGAGLSVIPRGGGTKLNWGNPPKRADVILSLQRLNHVVEHAWADLTVTVEAGCNFSELQRTLAERGQRLAVDPLWPERATLGGILSANDTGALRLYYGGLRDLVIGITLALADGTLAKSGGKVVKNVAGYDLPKLATGAIGTLGIITRAVFRVHPLPANTRNLSLEAGNAEQAQRMLLALLNSNVIPATIQVRAEDGGGPVVDIGLEGTEPGIASQESRIGELARPLAVGPATAGVWEARQELWTSPDTAAIAKISLIPSAIGKTLASIARLAAGVGARWRAVIQATGGGWLRIEAGGESCSPILQQLRLEIESDGGALVALRAPSAAKPLDAWGSAGDGLPLMLALKQQFDPQGTLNPGRYVGGI